MSDRKRTCAKRERPNLPVTCRLNIDDVNKVAQLCQDTGLPLSVVLEKLILYALPRVKLAPVTRVEMTFPEDGIEL